MNRIVSALIAAGMLASGLTAQNSSSQGSPTDSQALQSLLNEVRQLRKDLQTTSVAAQRVQIVLYRLEGQRVAIDRLTQQLQAARLDLATTQKNRQELAGNLKTTEDERERNPNPNERAALESYVTQARSKLERLAAEEEQKKQNLQNIEGQLQLEREKLAELEHVLDQLDASLSRVGR